MAEGSDGGAAGTPRVSTTNLGTGKQALERLREATYDIVDVTPSVASEEFHNISTRTQLTTGLLINTRFSAARFDRTPTHIARGGFDHYQVAMYLDGDTEFAAGRRVARLRPRDVVLIDVAQPNRTDMAAGQSGAVHVMSLVLPRPLLSSLLAAPDSASASLSPAIRRQGASSVSASSRCGAKVRCSASPPPPPPSTAWRGWWPKP